MRAIAACGLVSATALGGNWTAGAVPAYPDTWPVAEGNFTTPGDPGWVYFKPVGFDGRGCGIAPDGTVGCDIVPARWRDGTPVQEGLPGPPGSYNCGDSRCPLPPPGADQTVAGPNDPAQYAKTPGRVRYFDTYVTGETGLNQ